MNNALQTDAPTARPRRRVGVLLAWLAMLAGIWGSFCAYVAIRQGDWGPANAAGHATFVLGVLSYVVWALRNTAWTRRVRWSAALIPAALVALYYAQLSPLEAIHNGDVGIVGFRWRWAEPDEQLDLEVPLASSDSSPPSGDSSALPAWQPTPNDFPRFLGSGYWAEAPDPGVDFEQLAKPPTAVWRRKIGAGWSGFAVVGDLAVTQEQRGEHELVTCYDVQSGKLYWSHSDPVRWDPKGSGALGYPGPRATPTLYAERVVAQGATGIVNCLDARTGARIWSRATLAEEKTENVMWGKSGSPLVFGDKAVVSVGAPGASLVAYGLETGEIVWKSGSRRSSYASPILAELDGVEQVVSMDEGAVSGYRAADGAPLWEYDWPSSSDTGASTSQPIPVGDNRLFVSMGYGKGSALFRVSVDANGTWNCQTVWRNKQVMKTKMSNVVVKEGYVYGLDDVYLQCIELTSGKSRWKKRRSPSFGHGQILLMGNRLLALTEDGEMVIAEANPDAYRELASFPALSGLTWNTLALSGTRLLVRNAEEAACFSLPLADASSETVGAIGWGRVPAASLRE